MKNRLISALLLSAVTTAAFAETLTTNSTSHADPGVINEASILYWLEKRGEIKANATQAEKLTALNQYLGKKSFKPKVLPGALGRQMMKEQKTSFANYEVLTEFSANKVNNTVSKSRASKDAVTDVNVLALLIEFPDHQANKSTYTLDHYSKILFDKADVNNPNANITSASQYYYLESGGTFNFDGQVNNWPNATWLVADQSAAYYGGNDSSDNDKAVPELIKEAVTKAVAAGLDLSRYDLDNDSVIDHVMVFHSSTGEEAGGGSIGSDAIWSHRYVSTESDGSPAIIAGSDIKLYAYTVTPVDAKIGVIAHEFGHDLGYPDEYDTGNGTFGSPVGDWSIMASGSWVDGGSHPSGFSSRAKDFLQTKYDGNWINQQVVTLDNIANESINLVAAADHGNDNINQVKILLPNSSTSYAPYSGTKQFYSSRGHNLNSTLSFNADLPAGNSILTMKSHWEIEQDWDYALVTVNNSVIAGNYTKKNNTKDSDINDFISGDSLDIEGSQGTIGWVDLTFDLSAYENQSVEIKIAYITDSYVDGYGFVADDIKITSDNTELFFDGAEVQTSTVLAGGFSSSPLWVKEGESRNYYAQLRNYKGTDKYLDGEGYDAGVLIWYQDDSVSNNQVNSHPGDVFIGVVDNDQTLIKSYNRLANTGSQIRDAALSQFTQSNFNGDKQLKAITTFDDKLDYSSPFQPESGIALPPLGLSITVVSQEQNSNTATIELANNGTDLILVTREGKSISLTLSAKGLLESEAITWQLDDGTVLTGKAIEHRYENTGEYTVSVSYENQTGTTELTKNIIIGKKITGSIARQTNGKNVTFTPELIGGIGEFFYRWDFGDDSPMSNAEQVTHPYNSFGQYTITLSVLDGSGVIYNLEYQLILQEQPLALSTSYTIADLTVSFSSATTGGEGDKSYLWDFGDGNTSTLAMPAHTYSAAGSYHVTLTVTDSDGATAESAFSIVVTKLLPQITYTATELTVSFIGSATGGNGEISYAWDFGDGNKSTLERPTHTYSVAGTYNLALTVTDEDGVVANRSLSISVTDLTTLISHTITDLTVDFIGSATGGIGEKTYLWNFGDGNTSTLERPSHIYNEAGSYNITLIVTDSDLAMAESKLTVSVSDLKSSIAYTRDNLTVNFAGSATGGTGEMSYAWNFGDGNNSTLQNATHTYSAAGTFNITLTVIDKSGTITKSTSSVTVSAPVIVTPPPEPEPSASDSSGGSLNIFSLFILLVVARLRIFGNNRQDKSNMSNR